VSADPAAERVGVHVEVAHRAGEVAPHEQEPRLGVTPEQGHVVLAQDARGHVAHDQPRLGGERGRGTHPERSGERAGGLEPLVQPRGNGIQDVRQGVEVPGRPLGAIDDLGGRRRRGERQARVARHRPFHLGREDGGVEGRLLLGALARRQPRNPSR
jgi:hypothetical protein